MKTKTILFDLEMAKDIQDGKIEGKIKNKRGYAVRLICTDLKGTDRAIVGAVDFGQEESVYYYTTNGICMVGGEAGIWNLVLEVPDNTPQFKPFDRVICRDEENCVWTANLFSHMIPCLEYQYCVVGGARYAQCIPYEGNEHLIGTTEKPKE